MKTASRPNAGSFLIGSFFFVGFLAQAQLPFKPLGDAPANVEDQQQLNSIFRQARDASSRVSPGPNAGFQRRQITGELNNELERFVASHTNSAWTPGVRLWLARNAQLRSSYLRAMDHYDKVWAATRGSTDRAARQTAGEAMGGLGKLLALAGRLAELDALEDDARQLRAHPAGSEWARALEIRAWARKHPAQAYKCGLYCVDQLGRLTQPGQFQSQAITETESSVNGFTAADLVQIAAGAGLHMHAAFLNNLTNLPVPCILHLRSEHFVVIREQRGGFYAIYDTAAPSERWLTAEQVAQEASGCVIVSDAILPAGTYQLTPLALGAAADYRGRYFPPFPSAHNDSPCPGNKGGGGGGDGYSALGTQLDGYSALGTQPPEGCNNCAGMPTFFVSEPWLNLWVRDTPLQYDSAYGPDVTLRLAYNHRHEGSVVSGQLLARRAFRELRWQLWSLGMLLDVFRGIERR
jgi:hypothetical protein